MEENKEWHHMITVEDLGGLKRKVNITYDSIGVQMALDKAADIVTKQAKIKGFRKGKAPKTLIEKMYPEKMQEVASSLLSQEGFLHACYEQKISPLNEPQVENPEFNMDGTFTCEIFLEIRPVIAPTGYVGLVLQKREEDIEHISEHILEKLKSENQIDKDVEEVKEGTIININFTVTVENKEISSAEEHFFKIEKGLDPPFGENLLGMKPGEQRIETLTLPETYPRYANKEAEVTINLIRAFERLDPTDEELIVKANLSSLEELKNLINEAAVAEANKRQKQALEEQIIDKLITLNEFEIPESWVNDEKEYLSKQLQITKEDKETDKTIAEMSERNVRRTFILEAIADEEKIESTQEEIDAVLKAEADRLDTGVLALKNDLKKKGMMDGVLSMIKYRKVIDAILSQAQIEEPETTKTVPEGENNGE